MALRRSASASSIFPMALCHSAAILFAMALPASSSAAALRLAAVPRRPGQQKLRHGALASNKPHPAEKSTPVWLPIWCTWAGFANSQLRCATFHSTYSYKCTSSLLPPWSRCSDRRKSIGPSAPIAYATSVSPPDEAVAWLGRKYPMGDKAVAWPDAAFLQITARTNPCSRHLWGTLARAVASI